MYPPGTHTVTVTDQDGNVIGIGEITMKIRRAVQ